MDNNNIVYEKKFTHIPEPTDDEIANAFNPNVDLSSFSKQLLESAVRVIMPERIEKCDFFITTAAKIAEYYQIDTIVREYENHLSAEFRVDFNNTYSGLKVIFDFADDICFQYEDGAVILCVSYYTHATYRSGERILPENDLEYIL